MIASPTYQYILKSANYNKAGTKMQLSDTNVQIVYISRKLHTRIDAEYWIVNILLDKRTAQVYVVYQTK